MKNTVVQHALVVVVSDTYISIVDPSCLHTTPLAGKCEMLYILGALPIVFPYVHVH